MRRIRMHILLLFLGITTLWGGKIVAQPQAINYQAIARDGSGNILANHNINLRFSILDSAQGGTALYEETHKLFTNQFGLFNIKIGRGILVSGIFSSIPAFV